MLLRADKAEPPQILTLPDAAALIASRPGVPTLHRWISKGVRGHRLKSVMIGGRRMVLIEDLEHFLAALNDAPEPQTVVKNDNSDLVAAILGVVKNK